jgi:hypothetical protein
MRVSLTAAIVAVGLCLLVAGVSQAATNVGSLEPTTGTWRAYRGSNFSTLVCSNSSEAAMLQCIAADSERRATSTRYQLRYPNRYVTVTYTRPTCAPPRAPVTQQTACPNDVTRTFTQTQTWTVAPYPTCEIAGAWLPATPSVTDCPPTQLPAPTGVEATAVSTSEIRVRWNVVPDAVAYSLRRCIGATCDPLSRTPLLCTQTLDGRHVTLNPGTTVRYQVEAARVADCSGELSAPSSPVVSATTLTSTPPDPQPEPTGTAGLSWTPPTRNTDGSSLSNLAGYRISYGTTPEALTQTVQLANASLTAYTISGLVTGTYYFAVRAYTSGGTESVNSNVGSKIIQ